MNDIQLNEINNATVIVLQHEDFLKFIIDKENGQIIEVLFDGKVIDRNITNEALNGYDLYLSESISICRTRTPMTYLAKVSYDDIDEKYNTLGVVLAKILKSKVDKHCLGLLNFFDIQLRG